MQPSGFTNFVLFYFYSSSFFSYSIIHFTYSMYYRSKSCGSGKKKKKKKMAPDFSFLVDCWRTKQIGLSWGRKKEKRKKKEPSSLNSSCKVAHATSLFLKNLAASQNSSTTTTTTTTGLGGVKHSQSIGWCETF